MKAARDLIGILGLVAVVAGTCGYDWRLGLIVLGGSLAAGALYGVSKDAR